MKKQEEKEEAEKAEKAEKEKKHHDNLKEDERARVQGKQLEYAKIGEKEVLKESNPSEKS